MGWSWRFLPHMVHFDGVYCILDDTQDLIRRILCFQFYGHGCTTGAQRWAMRHCEMEWHLLTLLSVEFTGKWLYY